MTHIEQYVIPFFKEKGNFLEIGCWKGDHISQTKQLEELGWSGICVDPFPSDFEGRSCKLINKAVSRDGKPRDFVRVFKDRRCGGDVSYFSGFKDSIQFHWPVISEHCDYIESPIETIRFEDIGAPNHINFLSVDTEGCELEIISSIDFTRYSFDMIMFEHNGVNNGVAELLESKGYRLLKRLDIDDIYIREGGNIMHKEWLDNEYAQWMQALSESTVHNFKEHPMVRRMLSLDLSREIFYDHINGWSPSDNQPLLTIVKIDCIGYNYGPAYQPMPEGATLRMIYYAQQILSRNPSSICEIGGGVGQFYAILRALGYKGKYWIDDLLGIKKFQYLYLEEVEKQTRLNLSQDESAVEDCDLLVSFYALGEFTDEKKAEYIQEYKDVPHGYIAWNPHSGASDDLSIFKHDIKVTPGIEEGIKIIEW